MDLWWNDASPWYYLRLLKNLMVYHSHPFSIPCFLFAKELLVQSHWREIRLYWENLQMFPNSKFYLGNLMCISRKEENVEIWDLLLWCDLTCTVINSMTSNCLLPVECRMVLKFSFRVRCGSIRKIDIHFVRNIMPLDSNWKCFYMFFSWKAFIVVSFGASNWFWWFTNYW